MAGLKELTLAVQERLAGVAGIVHTDKDWGQLRCEQPPVKFPCALVDVERADFSELGHGRQLAEVTIVVTFANRRLIPTSGMATARADGYTTIELVERAHLALQSFGGGWFAPLVRTSLRRVYGDNAMEVYAATCLTQFTVGEPHGGTTAMRPEGVHVRLDPMKD